MKVFWHATVVPKDLGLPALYVNQRRRLRVIGAHDGVLASKRDCPINWFLVYDKPT